MFSFKILILIAFISRKSSKNVKLTKNTESRSVVEKTTKLEPKKSSNDLPAVQCKDTLLLDYDYNKQYSKRGLVNNWNKYAELPDNDDDDNGQLSAADFELLLSASKAIGDHFTFAAERSWFQSDNVNISDEGSMSADLFKLNISNLKNGIARVPFYSRQGLPEEMFTREEIEEMNRRADLLANSENQKTLDTLQTSEVYNQVSSQGDNVISEKVAVNPPGEAELASSLRNTHINNHLTKTTSALTPSTSHAPLQTPSSVLPKLKSDKTEDIQDWLDDILNES